MINRRRVVPAFIFLIGASMLEGTALAGPSLPPAPYKPIPVGTRLEYDSWSCVVEGSDGLKTVCRNARASVSTYGTFVPTHRGPAQQIMGSVSKIYCGKFTEEYPNNPVSIGNSGRSAIERFWPLKVGNEISFDILASYGDANVTMSVKRTEDVQVAGRQRSTYVVEQTVELAPIERIVPCYPKYRRTVWYEPSSGLIVRDRMRWMTGPFKGSGWDSSLVNAELPKGPVAAQTVEQIAKEKARLAKVRAEIAEAEAKEQARLAKLRAEIAEAEAEARRIAALRSGQDSQAAANAPTSPKVPAYINFGDYHALVIGIDQYRNLKPLKTAVADADAVAASLESKYGFKVTKLINPSREDILDALDALRETLTFKDNLLIYYAGHGWLDEKADRGYWLPANAQKNRRSRWVSNAAITDTLKALESKHVMVVSDSCYSGRLVRSAAVRIEKVDTPEYFQKMSRTKARVVITSGGLEPVEDGKGLHSPFARAFLQALEDNDGVIDGTKLFAAIRRPVMVSANQTPQYADVRRAGHDGGEFLFVRRH